MTTTGLNFFVDCVPPTITAQQKGATVRGRRVHFYTKESQRSAEEELQFRFLPYRPASPMDGPLAAIVIFTHLWRRQDLTRKGVRAADAPTWIPCDTRPDADNMAKALMDVLGKIGFYRNDSQIADLRIIKGWGQRPGIGIDLRECPAELPVQFKHGA
jgi:Holliday junction resolvase RusA-like endonuclease